MSEPTVVAHGQSYVGKFRDDNQDAIRLQEPEDAEVRAQRGSLYAVADGMGGHVNGCIASSLAIETFFNVFYAEGRFSTRSRLQQAMESSNMAVYNVAHLMQGSRMGTTLTVANIVGDQLHVAHVGDTRLYLVRDGQATCLTRDHSKVGDLVAMHVLSPDKVRTHEQRSELTRCLGFQLFVQPEFKQHTLRAGDTLIICCDGVWSVIEDEEFAGMAADFDDPNSLSQMLVDLAMKRESDDNLSVVSVRVNAMGEPAVAQAAGALTRLPRALLGRLMGRP